MDSFLFHQKMKDLKDKLSSINEDIVEIKRNNKRKYISLQKDKSPMQIQNIRINKKLFDNNNKTVNNAKRLESLTNSDVIYTLTSPSETPQNTPNRKIFFNANFYENLENNKIKKKLEKELTEEITPNIININEINYKTKNKYKGSCINLDGGEISFRPLKFENVKVINKLSNVMNSSRNPISLRQNKKYNPNSINNINQESNNNNDNNKRKDLINNKCNDNIINNSNTICISYDNDTIPRDNRIRKKILPNHNLYSLVSPKNKNKNLLNSKTVFFDLKSNKTINNTNNINSYSNISNDFELPKNEPIKKFQKNNRITRIVDIKGCHIYNGKLLKVKKNVTSKEKKNNIDNNEKQINNKNKNNLNYKNLYNKKKYNSISYNKLLVNGNSTINDRSNKLIRIQNKIININDNVKTNINNIDKEKLIVKINRQLMKKQKKSFLFNNSKSLHENIFKLDSKLDKKDDLSQNLINKLNQNIVDSKITHNFILKLMKLYYESTGLTIIQENDLNSTLTILYNWIENISKKFYCENKKINEEIQYKALRNKIMNQYQLKNKDELKSFLFKLLGND